MKIGDLVKPHERYLDEFTRPLYLPAGIITEVVYEDKDGDLESETVFSVQWPGNAGEAEWNDWELELVSESR